ncbi:hypothetical protein [Sorangium sp. So ce131]|uniref:hypothetical protein n=1 Tax=Sorangium sp. So ce131 TaxID=3133282 RepID=UPI003F5DDE4A
MNPPSAPAEGDFLDRLLDSAAGTATVVEPRVPSLFEPAQGFSSGSALRHGEEPHGASEAFGPPQAAGAPRASEPRPVPWAEALAPRPEPREGVERTRSAPGAYAGGGVLDARAGDDLQRGSSRARPGPPLHLASDPGLGGETREIPELGAPAPAAPSASTPDRLGLLPDPRRAGPSALLAQRMAAPGADRGARGGEPRTPGQPSQGAPRQRASRAASPVIDAGGALVPHATPSLRRAVAHALPPDRQPRSAALPESAPIDREPVVNVTIGRLEVRAVQEPRKAPRTEQRGPQPMSLEDYLKGRAGAR